MFNSRAYKFLCLIFVCSLVKLTQVSFKSNEKTLMMFIFKEIYELIDFFYFI